MINTWILITLVFGVSFDLSLRVARMDLKLSKGLYIIVISALVALTPLLGPYLGFLPAVFLVNRKTDEGLGDAIGVVTLPWLIAFIAILLGIVLFRVYWRLESSRHDRTEEVYLARSWLYVQWILSGWRDDWDGSSSVPTYPCGNSVQDGKIGWLMEKRTNDG